MSAAASIEVWADTVPRSDIWLILCGRPPSYRWGCWMMGISNMQPPLESGDTVTGAIGRLWADLMWLFFVLELFRWSRRSMATEPIPSGSTVFWTLPPQWAGSAKQIPRTKFSTCVFVLTYFHISPVISVGGQQALAIKQPWVIFKKLKQMSSVLTVWFICSVPFFNNVTISPSQPQQNRVHQGQVSDVGVRSSHALSGGWQRDGEGPQQGWGFFCT